MHLIKQSHIAWDHQNCSVFRSPAFIGDLRISSAGEVLDIPQSAVDEAPVRFADGQEVRSQAADGVFGDVGQRLAQRRSEHEGSHGLVHTHYIFIT